MVVGYTFSACVRELQVVQIVETPTSKAEQEDCTVKQTEDGLESQTVSRATDLFWYVGFQCPVKTNVLCAIHMHLTAVVIDR